MFTSWANSVTAAEMNWVCITLTIQLTTFSQGTRWRQERKKRGQTLTPSSRTAHMEGNEFDLHSACFWVFYFRLLVFSKWTTNKDKNHGTGHDDYTDISEYCWLCCGVTKSESCSGNWSSCVEEDNSLTSKPTFALFKAKHWLPLSDRGRSKCNHLCR